MAEVIPKGHGKVLSILSNLDDASFVPTNDRRSKARIPFRHETHILLLGVMGSNRFKVNTRNLSTSGVGLLSRRPFQVGDRFVLPVDVQGAVAKLLLCRVTFSRYISNGLHDIGAQFEKAIPNPNGDQMIPQEWIDMATEHRAPEVP